MEKDTEFSKYDYWFWQNHFTKDEISALTKLCDENLVGRQDEKFSAHDLKGKSKKTSDVYWVLYKTLRPFLNDFIKQVLWTINHKFGYVTFDYGDMEYVLYNTYSSKRKAKYDWHNDMANDITFDIKATLLIDISPAPYKGGTFKILNNNVETIDRFSKPGDVLLFKPHLHHMVEPVTKGTRKSLAIFLTGPKFR